MTFDGQFGDEPFLDEGGNDEQEDYEPEERETVEFGCACQDPIIVDTVCPSCIAQLAEQDRMAREEKQTNRPIDWKWIG